MTTASEPTNANATAVALAALSQAIGTDEIFDEPDDNAPVLLQPSFLDWREVATWQ
ncbi:MAG: hypothetical protein R2762_23250 [Bryobacteraceae bacterium]